MTAPRRAPQAAPGARVDETTRRRASPDDRRHDGRDALRDDRRGAGTSGAPVGALLGGPAGGGRGAGRTVVGVVGARGGVGASTVAAALAVSAVRAGLSAVLVDGRHEGAGVDVLLGVEDEPGLRWADLQDARGEVDPRRLLGLLPRWSGAWVLSADRARTLPRPDEVERDVLRALGSAADVLVLDLPAGRLPEHAAHCDAVVVVARCDTLSVAGAQSVVAALPGVPLGLVCRGTGAARLLPHEVAAASGAELWGEIVSDPGMRAAVEAGAGPRVLPPSSATAGRRGPSRSARRGRGGARSSLGSVAGSVLTHAIAVARARTDAR